MKEDSIRFGDLSGWLKFAFIWTLIECGMAIVMILLYAIAGVSLLD